MIILLPVSKLGTIFLRQRDSTNPINFLLLKSMLNITSIQMISFSYRDENCDFYLVKSMNYRKMILERFII